MDGAKSLSVIAENLYHLDSPIFLPISFKSMPNQMPEGVLSSLL